MAIEGRKSTDRFYTFLKSRVQGIRFIVLYRVNQNDRQFLAIKNENVLRYNYLLITHKFPFFCQEPFKKTLGDLTLKAK